MKMNVAVRWAAGLGLAVWGQTALALDSYRFMHVSIDTPWTIFLFLLTVVLTPFVLMAVLMWRYAERKKAAHPSEKGRQP